MKFLILFALCATLAFSQDDVFNFGGSIDEVELAIRVETPVVRPGQTVRGICEVKQEPDQTIFNFVIGRMENGQEVILSTVPYFSFTAEKEEDVGHLFCRVTRGQNQEPQTQNFQVSFIAQEMPETNLDVQALPRGPDTTLLVCKISPKPASLAHYRFKWIAPTGRVLSNGPIASVKTDALKSEGADGYVCEVLDLSTRQRLTQGLRLNSNIHSVQSMISYSARIMREPKALQGNQPLTMTAILVPMPAGRVTYTWKFNDVILPGQNTAVYRIDRLMASHQGTYTCEMRFMDQSGTPMQLVAKEILMRRGGQPAASDVRLGMEITPKQEDIDAGNKAIFHCNLDGPGADPRQITWKHQKRVGSTMFPETRLMVDLNPGWVVEYSARSSFITKMNANIADTGFYICMIGQLSDYAILNVNEAPERSAGSWEAEEIPDQTLTCRANERMCNDGRTCGRTCDGVRDCAGGEDEQNCNCDPAIRSCRASRNGQQPTKQTYNVNWECDGENDCGNGYDEEDCGPANKIASCHYQTNNRYQCKSTNRTIPIAYLCDGSNDCEFRDDEERCQMSGKSFERAYQPEQTVKVGETITLTCTISAYPVPRVIWRFNWRCLPGQESGQSQTGYFDKRYIPRYDVSSTVTSCEMGRTPTVTSKLVITNAQVSDTGIFNCEAIGSGKERPMSDDFNVNVSPRYY